MFSVNQKVVCVDANFDERTRRFYTALPEQDRIHVIREMMDGVLLVGLQNPCSEKPPHFERGFHERRFRPLLQLPPIEMTTVESNPRKSMSFSEAVKDSIWMPS